MKETLQIIADRFIAQWLRMAKNYGIELDKRIVETDRTNLLAPDELFRSPIVVRLNEANQSVCTAFFGRHVRAS